jgi:peptide/nickel transport system permease protein
MIGYLIRRILYAIPILIGVNVLTFFLFFVVNTPDNMARAHLGTKHVTQAAIEKWKVEHGYDKPLLLNPAASGTDKLTQTIFFQKSARMFLFDFGVSDDGRSIGQDIKTRMWPSLAIALPDFVIGISINIIVALLMVFFRATRLDLIGVVVMVALMSISGLFYIIAGQYWIAKVLKLVPISGYESGLSAFRFVILPVAIGVVSGLGSGARWYRTIFLEEINRDYVRTARAKGLSELAVLFRHVLKNGMIPILTGAVVVIPTLFLGSLVMERFFAIPGLGSYTIDAISAQDFAIVRAMVFLGGVLYIIGLILTDISYTLVDPRVRLE